MDGSAVTAASNDGHGRPPSNDDEMHSLPQSDQSPDGLASLRPPLNHMHTPDKEKKVLGWLSSASASTVVEQDVNQPPEAPASHGSTSPPYGALTADDSGHNSEPMRSPISSLPTGSGHTDRLFSPTDSVNIDHRRPSDKIFSKANGTVVKSSALPVAAAGSGNGSSYPGSSLPSSAKKTSAFYDDPDHPDLEAPDYSVGLMPRQEPSELDDEEESPTPGVLSTGSNAIIGDVSHTNSQASAIGVRDGLRLPVQSRTAAADSSLLARASNAVAQGESAGRPTTSGSLQLRGKGEMWVGMSE